jgi:hypothetical protein
LNKKDKETKLRTRIRVRASGRERERQRERERERLMNVEGIKERRKLRSKVRHIRTIENAYAQKNNNKR